MNTLGEVSLIKLTFSGEGACSPVRANPARGRFAGRWNMHCRPRDRLTDQRVELVRAATIHRGQKVLNGLPRFTGSSCLVRGAGKAGVP